MSMFDNIAVYGGGSWGTALACQAARTHKKVQLILRSQEIIKEILNSRTNSKYLGNCRLAGNIYPYQELEAALSSEILIIAVPSRTFKETIEKLKAANLPANIVLLIATKGLVGNPTKLLSNYLGEMLPNPIAFITGPNFAKEVAQGLLTSTTIAATNLSLAKKLSDRLSSKNFSITITTDIITIQIAGAVKNIIAIGCGIYNARGYGENAQASLIVQGLEEIRILAAQFDGKIESLTLPAVVGDLILTCTSPTSRNKKFGFELGSATNVELFLDSYAYLVEGKESVRLIQDLSLKQNLKLPIISWVAKELRI